MLKLTDHVYYKTVCLTEALCACCQTPCLLFPATNTRTFVFTLPHNPSALWPCGVCCGFLMPSHPFLCHVWVTCLGLPPAEHRLSKCSSLQNYISEKSINQDYSKQKTKYFIILKKLYILGVHIHTCYIYVFLSCPHYTPQMLSLFYTFSCFLHIFVSHLACFSDLIYLLYFNFCVRLRNCILCSCF